MKSSYESHLNSFHRHQWGTPVTIYRNILLEVKDVIFSLDRFASCLYIGKLLRQVQSNTRGTQLIALEEI